jgi:ABC-2 type transport system permease protein
MSVWRLEWLRMWRTRRLIALAAIFLILGLGSPVLTYYLPDIVNNSNNSGVQIVVPKQTAADGIRSFVGNLAQLGTLVVVIVASASLAFDARPALSAFYRTRLRSSARLVLPRMVVVAVATAATLALGFLGTWYETAVLLGSVSALGVLAGFAVVALWFWFVISVVAVFASVLRSVLAVAGASIGCLLALSLVGGLSSRFDWLPTKLVGSAADVVMRQSTGIWSAATVGVAASIVATLIALIQFSKREL